MLFEKLIKFGRQLPVRVARFKVEVVVALVFLVVVDLEGEYELVDFLRVHLIRDSKL